MKITFEGESLGDIIAEIQRFGAALGYDLAPDAPPVDEEAPKKRKRRTKAEMDAARAAENDETSPADSAEKEEEGPTRRRRSAKPSNAPAETDADEAEPSRRRRRGKSAGNSEDVSGAEDSPPEESAAAEPTRRRRRGKSSAGMAENASTDAPARRRRGTAGPSPDDAIKDEDLVKAASTLAQATNPGVVMELLGEFGCDQVQQLEGEARREFLDLSMVLADEED